MKKIAVLFTLFLIVFQISAQKSAVDKWVSIDDKTGKKKSVVELYKEDGKLYGKIIYLFPREGREPNAKCTKCTDDRKDQPLVGLQIIRDLEWNGTEWEGGTIVDPENGKIYNTKLWVSGKNGEFLQVRGYLGPFFRTQTWIRVQKD